jgi:hypothetical protein
LQPQTGSQPQDDSQQFDRQARRHWNRCGRHRSRQQRSRQQRGSRPHFGSQPQAGSQPQVGAGAAQVGSTPHLASQPHFDSQQRLRWHWKRWHRSGRHRVRQQLVSQPHAGAVSQPHETSQPHPPPPPSIIRLSNSNAEAFAALAKHNRPAAITAGKKLRHLMGRAPSSEKLPQCVTQGPLPDPVAPHACWY